MLQRSLRYALLALTVLSAGCGDSRFGEPAGDGEPQPLTTTIARVCRTFTGEATLITGDLRVAGRVTTSDRAENFYRTFCIEEEGAAIEVMAGLDHLHNDFPEGALVQLSLKGFTLGRYRGVLQLGRMPAAENGFATDFIGSSRAALDRAVVRIEGALAPVEPAVRRIDELTAAMCGTLVRVDGLRYAPEEVEPGTSWAGYRRFEDDRGAEIFTFVRAYARFAEEEMPAGRCSLQGILQYDERGEERYIIKLRDEEDCMRQEEAAEGFRSRGFRLTER